MKRNKLKVKICGKEFNLNAVDLYSYEPDKARLNITFKSGNTSQFAPVSPRENKEFSDAMNEADTLEAAPDNG